MVRNELDKLFVNCNVIKEHEAKRILISKDDLSLKSWEWEVPINLKDISKCDCYRFDTFIGVGRWNANKEKDKNKYICIAQKGNLIYLNKWLIKILYNSLKDDSPKKGVGKNE